MIHATLGQLSRFVLLCSRDSLAYSCIAALLDLTTLCRPQAGQTKVRSSPDPMTRPRPRLEPSAKRRPRPSLRSGNSPKSSQVGLRQKLTEQPPISRGRRYRSCLATSCESSSSVGNRYPPVNQQKHPAGYLLGVMSSTFDHKGLARLSPF